MQKFDVLVRIGSENLNNKLIFQLKINKTKIYNNKVQKCIK